MGRRGLGEVERARLVGCVLGGAILVAPFLALLYGAAAGLAATALALGVIAAFAGGVARGAPAPVRRRLVAVAAVNGALAVACAVALAAGLG